MTKKHLVLTVSIVSIILVGGVTGLLLVNSMNKGAATATVNEESTREASPAVAQPVMPVMTYTGQFVDGDAVHSGEGGMTITETKDGAVLAFDDNFKTSEGPDLFVYLSSNAADQGLGDYVSLGTLQSISGAQAYALPTNYKEYKTVVVWCREFSATFATAQLRQV